MDSLDLIYVLRACLKSEPILKEITDWNSLYSLAERQSVIGMLFSAVENTQSKPSREICGKLEVMYFATIQRMTQYDFVRKKLICEFDKAKIKATFFKGIIVKDSYPCPELRTMSDIDILIHSADRNSTDIMLKSMGAECISASEPVYLYRLMNVNLEVHTSFAEDIYAKPKILEICGQIWDNVTQYSEYVYIPTSEFHLILMLIHTFRHFTGVGCGVRLFMDIGVFYTANKDKINKDNLKSTLNRIELEKFARLAFYLNKKWFGYEDIYDFEYPEEIYIKITDYITACGTFGSDIGTTGGKSVRNRIGDKKGVAKLFAKIKFIFSRAFPPYKKIKEKYKFVKACPILLPIGWIANIFSQITHRGRYLTDYTKNILLENSEDKRVCELFNELNL